MPRAEQSAESGLSTQSSRELNTILKDYKGAVSTTLCSEINEFEQACHLTSSMAPLTLQ